MDRYGHLLPSLDQRLRGGLEATYRSSSAGRCGTHVGPGSFRCGGKGPNQAPDLRF